MKNSLYNHADGVNVGRAERVISLLGGAALVAYGASRRSIPGTLLAFVGGLMTYRGASGHCRLYRGLRIDTAHNEYGVPGNKGIKVERKIRIRKPASEIYDFWRNLSNLPSFMPHLISVEERDSQISHWVVRGPAGSHLSWDAEIINEHPGELISWQSLPGAQVENAGTIRFHAIENGRATIVSVSLQYHPPVGSAGAALARMMGEAPEQRLSKDLISLRDVMEASH